MSATDDINLIVNEIDDEIDQMLSVKQMRLLGNSLIRLIVARTKRGYGVDPSSKRRQSLKNLSASYKSFRARYSRLLASDTSVTKSNLTFSGQLLRSLVVARATDGSVIIRANRRNRRRILNEKARVTNEAVSRFVTAQGRNFLDLSIKERVFLAKNYDDILQDLIDSNKDLT